MNQLLRYWAVTGNIPARSPDITLIFHVATSEEAIAAFDRAIWDQELRDHMEHIKTSTHKKFEAEEGGCLECIAFISSIRDLTVSSWKSGVAISSVCVSDSPIVQVDFPKPMEGESK